MSLSPVAMANVAGSESPMNASFPATDALCSNSAGCLFATEAGVFKAWHLILIIATIVTIAGKLIDSVTKIRRVLRYQKGFLNTIRVL